MSYGTAQGLTCAASATHDLTAARATGLIEALTAAGVKPFADKGYQTVKDFLDNGSDYRSEHSTRPQTIGYALLDSPVALAAWPLDHDTDSYYNISRAFLGGPPSGNLTRDHVLDNIMLYWLTGTGVSAGRYYCEGQRARNAGGGKVPPPVTVPVGFSAFPGEHFQAPRSWVLSAYPTLMYYNKPDHGGHFAAWKEPDLFASELRAAFRPLAKRLGMEIDHAKTVGRGTGCSAIIRAVTCGPWQPRARR
ncbi:hypothetical protein [Nonomuraea cypriaca]|uniref:hypothetical protein n=1 Tax=Nonomuraea cypriaca TaxID=1187855 RepID=UPI0038B3E8D1